MTRSARTAAIDAAARTWFDRDQAGRKDDGRHRPDGRLWQFDDITEHDQHTYRALVEPIVDAALNEAADRAARARGDQ